MLKKLIGQGNLRLLGIQTTAGCCLLNLLEFLGTNCVLGILTAAAWLLLNMLIGHGTLFLGILMAAGWL